MHRLAALLLFVLLIPASARGDAGFWATPVPLGPGQEPGAVAGKLVFKGALELAADDTRFGGLSGLHVAPDLRVTAISDRGYFVGFDLVEDAEGTLLGATALQIERMVDATGQPLRIRDRDAEDVAVLADGTRLVVFERNARLGWFAPGAPRQERVATLLDLVDTSNEGIESVVPLGEDRFLLIAEHLGSWASVRRGWIGKPGAWQGIEYSSPENDDVSSAALLPGGDLLVLERSANVLTGFRSALRRVPATLIRPGARLVGDMLVELAAPGLSDNFEGVAVHPLPGGRAAIYLVSDDNYFALQRTYLVKLELAPL
jgi:hypothetical protein